MKFPASTRRPPKVWLSVSPMTMPPSTTNAGVAAPPLVSVVDFSVTVPEATVRAPTASSSVSPWPSIVSASSAARLIAAGAAASATEEVRSNV